MSTRRSAFRRLLDTPCRFTLSAQRCRALRYMLRVYEAVMLPMLLFARRCAMRALFAADAVYESVGQR